LATATGPLLGLKVLDLSIIVAGGTASSLLADFGAEVVKVERPVSGDPLRYWGPFKSSQSPGETGGIERTSIWWKVHSRNKKSVTLDLNRPEGQRLLRGLARKADLLIEGFRPGTLEEWGLGPTDLHRVNPGLVIVRFSGFGQTGPYKDRAGFGTIAECMSGYIGMTGFPDSPPVLPPIPLADEVAGVFGAMAGMMALYHRDVLAEPLPDPFSMEYSEYAAAVVKPRVKRGQVIDVSLFEPLFRLCIPHITMFDLLGIVRERVGNDFPDAAPRNLYLTGDGRWLGLSATSQSTWESLARAMGLPELLKDARFRNNAARLENREALNQVLQKWIGQRSVNEVMEQLVPSGGVVAPVYTSADIVADPHYQVRQDIIEIEDSELGHTRMLGVVPKFSDTPGSVEHTGPRLGEHNYEVYRSWLGYSEEDIDELVRHGVI